jgi:hypothetical protein
MILSCPKLRISIRAIELDMKRRPGSGPESMRWGRVGLVGLVGLVGAMARLKVQSIGTEIRRFRCSCRCNAENQSMHVCVCVVSRVENVNFF